LIGLLYGGGVWILPLPQGDRLPAGDCRGFERLSLLPLHSAERVLTCLQVVLRQHDLPADLPLLLDGVIDRLFEILTRLAPRNYQAVWRDGGDAAARLAEPLAFVERGRGGRQRALSLREGRGCSSESGFERFHLLVDDLTTRHSVGDLLLFGR
jgi:hypothetical protein